MQTRRPVAQALAGFPCNSYDRHTSEPLQGLLITLQLNSSVTTVFESSEKLKCSMTDLFLYKYNGRSLEISRHKIVKIDPWFRRTVTGVIQQINIKPRDSQSLHCFVSVIPRQIHHELYIL